MDDLSVSETNQTLESNTTPTQCWPELHCRRHQFSCYSLANNVFILCRKTCDNQQFFTGKLPKTRTRKNLDFFFCKKPQKLISVNIDNQLEHVFSSDHSHFSSEAAQTSNWNMNLNLPSAKTRLCIICEQKSKLERNQPIQNWSPFWHLLQKQCWSNGRPRIRMALRDPARFSSQ